MHEKQPTFFGVFEEADLDKTTGAGRAGVPKSAPYQKHSATSAEAAAAVSHKLSTQERVVYEYIKSTGLIGTTDNEAINILRDKYPSMGNSYRPRRIALLQMKLITKLKEPRLQWGNHADVYVATVVAEAKPHE